MAQKKKRPAVVTNSNDALWDECHRVQNAAAERTAQVNARLEAAALSLGFTRNENGEWEQRCPHCARRVELFATRGGDVRARASGSDARTCPAIPGIQQRLCDEGFQS